MSDYQDLILENQIVLEELEQECQDKINENMAYALQYMDAYDYRMHIGHLKKEMNNVILIYGLCDMVHRAMTPYVQKQIEKNQEKRHGEAVPDN